MSDFRYSEDEILQAVLMYIRGTYGEHYASGEDRLQLFDVWHDRGTLMTTAIDTAMKYLYRFGQKQGHNPNDLFKAIHYIVLALWSADDDGLFDDDNTPQPLVKQLEPDSDQSRQFADLLNTLFPVTQSDRGDKPTTGDEDLDADMFGDSN